MRQKKIAPLRRRSTSPEPSPVDSTLRPRLSLFQVWQERLTDFNTRWRNVILVVVGATLGFSLMLVYDSLKPPAQNLTQDDIDQAVARTMASATPPPAVAALVAESISPSLVRIVAERDDPDPKKRFIIGTGIIVDDTGTILSALHIVQDAKRIEVTFWNGDTTEALIEVKQPANDIVVLRPTLPPEPLIPATLGNPNSVRPGDQVVVVGHPFGIVNSVTVGVVSGVHRSFKSSITGETITNTIQFDAAVNPGNSGGPLLNRYGEVIGVVSGLINPTEQNVFIGIGYAVPIQTAARAFGEPED